MELIDFQFDLPLKSVASTLKSVWPFIPTENYPILVRIVLKIKENISLNNRHKPRFLIDIERTVQKNLDSVKRNQNQLLVNQKIYLDSILEAYRNAFQLLLEKLSTFKHILVKIKESYEDALSIRDKQINMNNTLLKVLGIPEKHKQKDFKIKFLEDENKNLMTCLDCFKRNNETMKAKIKELENELVCKAAVPTVEESVDSPLFSENYQLKNNASIRELDTTKDPVILDLALKQCRKDLSKAIQELNAMSDDYADAIPKKDYELLESDHIILTRDYKEASKQLIEFKERYNNLISKYSTLKEEAVEWKDKCTDLEQFGSPRPQWEICGDFIGGGTARWKLLSKGMSSREQLHVILRELGPAAQKVNQEYFDGMGVDPVVPPYLRYDGKVRNLRLSRRELSILINDIWSAKANYEKELTMQDFLTLYFSERYQQVNVRAEWAYNLCNGCEQMLDDQQIKLFWGVLNGSRSQDVYYAHRNEWNKLKENMLKNSSDPQNVVSMENLEKTIKMTFPLKSDVEVNNIMEMARRQLKIKSTALEVDIDKLFAENEEGFDRTDLAIELLRQRQISQEKYIREIINQLGGKKTPNKLISVDVLKRAFVIIDPHIDHLALESNIRWVFSDKTSNLNMIYPITLRVLATKLSSGNIERVGPRIKRKLHRSSKTSESSRYSYSRYSK